MEPYIKLVAFERIVVEVQVNIREDIEEGEEEEERDTKVAVVLNTRVKVVGLIVDIKLEDDCSHLEDFDEQETQKLEVELLLEL